jgi:hypothetical protein
MTRTDKIGLIILLGLIAAIYILAGFLIEPCDNEPGCYSTQEFKHEIK